MYLKEIKTHGFKSFADCINIEFSKTITGIVGPNGSGKSNIVDAIRWVLGEQSIKSLRGGSLMSDVIFSGSKTRNQQNVASVSLVFDNNDKYLPIDYTEVEIKRRLYKDGTNEYYLNNEKCRLKDINDILLDSAMAKESFNIISQGKIEEILSNKPSERRIIFEEAAGLLKYKKRKEDALRKLDRTNVNLDRIQDIINELNKQQVPLKEQAEQTKKYNYLKKQLDQIEISLITNDITRTNDKYQKEISKINIISNDLLTLTTNNTKNEAMVEKYKYDITNISREINILQTKLINISTTIEKLNSKKQLLLERSKQRLNSTTENKVINLKEQSLKIEAKISNLNNEINNSHENIEQLNIKITQIENDIQTIKESKKKYEQKLQQENRNEILTKNKIELLKKEIDNNTILPYSVNQILNNKKLNGIHNVIGNLIETTNELKIAIAVSLANNSSFIVTDNELNAHEAIKFLKQNKYGRATFFPLNIIKPRVIETSSFEDLTGFIDIAANLVKYDKKYKNIILNQLGNVIIVDNIDNANKISKQINHKYKIVTLDGELIHVGGSISGGINKTKNIITIKYELEENIKNLEIINKHISKIEKQINEYDNNLKTKEDDLYLTVKDKIKQTETKKIKDLIVLEQSNSLEQIKQEINDNNVFLNGTVSSEETNILEQYYTKIKLKDQLLNTIELLTKKKNEQSYELNNYELALKKENSQYNIKNSELKQSEILKNRLDVKLDNMLNNLSESYHLTYEQAKESYELTLDENKARNEVNNLKNTLKEIGEINPLAITQYEEINKRHDFLDNQKQDLIQALETLLEIIKEMDDIMAKEFIKTFKVINENFKITFQELFKGGNAELILSEPNNILETGIEIIASPPGKKLTTIQLLSGGEKTFTAISLLFAIIKSRKTPFCILDEVEAALDEVNVESFGKYLQKLKEKTQFIIITHKKKTMEYVDTLYGITMQESGISKLVSVKLEETK
ncbi:MAG: AAA family ATPase [Bacilli bacterium]